MENLQKRLAGIRKPLWILAAFAMVAVIAGTGHLAGSSERVQIFYLAPVALVAWFVGLGSALLLSIACAIITSLESGLSYWAGASNTVYTALFAYILSRLKGARIQNERLLRTDGITGIANRNSFYDLAGREMSRNRRYLHPFTVAYLDIDNLKMVNYKFGYKKGDELLRLVAETIHNNVREVDILSRLGGDEFALLLPETGAEGAQVVLSRLKNKLLENAARRDLAVTFSFGATTFVKSPDSVEDLVKRALVQMYSAKNSGPNSIDQDVFGSE